MADTTKTTADEFQDPLENYEPKTFSDGLERTLCEETVAAIHSQPFKTIADDTPVEEALQTLTGIDIASVLVVNQNRLAGIFTDRDVLDNAALNYEEVKDLPVKEIMTKNPVFVRDQDSPAAALCVMAAAGYRHVPVLNSQDEIVGIISPQRICEFLADHLES